MNFVRVTHLFTAPVMYRLVKLKPPGWPPLKARGETNDPRIGLGASLRLRGHAKEPTEANWLDDVECVDLPELVQWDSMRRLLKQARTAIMRHPIGAEHLSGEMARVMLSRLDAAPKRGGNAIFWHTDNGPYHDRTARFHVPLITNPACVMYSGAEVQHFAIGDLWYINNHVLHSAANFGTEGHYRVHLIFEMYKKPPVDDGDPEA